MEQAKTLAEFLQATSPLPEPDVPRNEYEALADLSGEDFCKSVLATREFRQYILNGIVLGDIPPAILGRIMDHAWGKPPDKLELTGKNGGAIETVTEVRRVIVAASALHEDDKRQVTH